MISFVHNEPCVMNDQSQNHEIHGYIIFQNKIDFFGPNSGRIRTLFDGGNDKG